MGTQLPLIDRIDAIRSSAECANALDAMVESQSLIVSLYEALDTLLAMPDFDGTLKTSIRRLNAKRAARAALVAARGEA